MDIDNYWKRRRTTRRRVLAGTGVVASGLAATALVGCGSSDDDDDAKSTTSSGSPSAGTAVPTGSPKTGGTIKTTINGDPPSLDPYLNLSYRAQGVASFVYSRLFNIKSGPDIDPGDLQVEPDVAASREIPDPQTFTVKLKPGVKWQNVAPMSGRPFTSADVKYTFERFMKLSPN